MSSTTKKSPFIHRLFYDIFWWPEKMRLIFNFFLHFKIESQENLKKLKGPLIIVSNHASWIDPFLIGAVFPRDAGVFPIRYACWYRYFYFPLFTPVVWMFGAFPIRKGLGLERVLGVPIKILEKGGVVGLFPEGKMRRGGRLRKGRRGVAYLSYKTKTPILPIKIEGNLGMNIIGFFLRRYRVKVKIGKVFSLPPKKIEKTEDLNQPSDFIMERVRAL